jgi:hypothetical protein
MPPSAAGVSNQNHTTAWEIDASRLPHDPELAKLFMLHSMRIQMDAWERVCAWSPFCCECESSPFRVPDTVRIGSKTVGLP